MSRHVHPLMLRKTLRGASVCEVRRFRARHSSEEKLLSASEVSWGSTRELIECWTPSVRQRCPNAKAQFCDHCAEGGAASYAGLCVAAISSATSTTRHAASRGRPSRRHGD